MIFPEELFYSKSHSWVKFEDGTTATIGVTEYALSELNDGNGSIESVDLPEEGEEFDIGDVVGTIKTVDASAEINTPLAGRAADINEDVQDEPTCVSDDPYEAWIVKIEKISDREDLLDAEEYKEYINTLR